MKGLIWDAIAVAGFAAICAGLAAIYWPLGLIGGGGLLVIIGLRSPLVAAARASTKREPPHE